MGIRFGTGGWRAVIGDGFTKANVQLLTAALARRMREEGGAARGFLVGYDRRFLSREAAHWAAEVMAGAEIPCLVVEREAPTPMLMFAVSYYDLPCGMAVTASHNPALYNGVKVFTEGGRDASEEVTASIEAYIRLLAGEDIPVVPYEEGVRTGRIRIVDPMNPYIDAIIRSVNMDAIRARGLKVALDPMYGVSKTALQTILITARCDVDVIHERRDALFGGRLPAPNGKTMVSLQSFVEEHGCDIGIATDGDADRLGVIDDQGEFLHPNKILSLLYYYLLRYKGWRGPAVRNLATTHLLDAVAADFGEDCWEVPVGFKHVSGKMRETGALIGGESSGGLTVRGHIQGKDGIYAAALLVEMMATTGRRLSELYQEMVDRYGRFEMVERGYRFSREERQRISALLLEDRRLPEFGRPVEQVSYADGCKVRFQGGGWAVCRFSGTEPLLRIFCEMDREDRAAAEVRRLEEFLGLDGRKAE